MNPQEEYCISMMGWERQPFFLIRMRRLEENKERMATEVNKIKMDHTLRHPATVGPWWKVGSDGEGKS